MSGSVTLSLAELRTQASLAYGASEAFARLIVEASLSANLEKRPAICMAHLPDYLTSMIEGRIDGQAEPVIDQPLPAINRGDGRRGIA